MAFDWTKVLVPPTGSTGVDTGSHLDVDEPPPWSDVDLARETLTSLATETATFSGFDLSLAGGEKQGFRIWARMRCNSVEGFNVTIVLKQGVTTLWTSPTFPVTNTTQQTYVIPVPDSAFVGSDIDNLSLDWTLTNLRSANQNLDWTWMRISKSPFTTAQQATLPPTLMGQDFVCYRAADLTVLGAVNGEAVVLAPDASGNGRHAILKFGTVSFDTAAPAGLVGAPGRLIGTLGYDPTAAAPIEWVDNKVFHFRAYPTDVTSERVIFSMVDNDEFLGGGVVSTKHILAIDVGLGGWVLMSGDGTGPAHLYGGSPTANSDQRVTEWIQVAGGNERLWEGDNPAPVIDASSGDNTFGWWSLLLRESDERPFAGRLSEVWLVEATGITEADIDSARTSWMTGGGTNPPVVDDGNRMGGNGAIRRPGRRI